MNKKKEPRYRNEKEEDKEKVGWQRHEILPTSTKRAESVLLAWPLDQNVGQGRRGIGASSRNLSHERGGRQVQDLLQEVQRFLTRIRDFCLPTLLQL